MEMKRGDETRPDSAYLILVQEGSIIKGSMGPNAEKQLRIIKGTIEGPEIVLEAAFKREKKPVTSADKLEFAMSPRGGVVVWIRKSVE